MTNDPVLFFGHRFGPHRVFSNWYPAEFSFGGHRWANSEQAFMYYKSLDDEIYKARILNTTDPKRAKQLGRQVTLRSDWSDVRYPVMVAVNYEKFFQNEDIKSILLSTLERDIHENCADPVWGGGPNFPAGLDLLGKALIEVRRRLSRLPS